VALAAGDHVQLVRLSGEGAFDLLDAVCPRPLFLRDGQALHGVLLDDAARPIVDLYVVADDLDYLLVAEGLSGADLVDWLKARGPQDLLDCAVTDQTPDHGVLSLHGPYAWELVARLTSPDVLGIPYLSFFDVPGLEGLCLRAGKTGEYGYLFVVPRRRLGELRSRLERLGTELGLERATLDELDLCALENGFFSIRDAAAAELTPIELQLQWRVDPRRDFPGADALRAARRARPPRLTWVRGPVGGAVPPGGAVVELADGGRGQLVAARHSPLLGAAIGTVLLPRDRAHPGQDATVAGEAGWRTASSPLLDNRSLFIDTQRHCWASRELDRFPPVVPERSR